MPPNATIRGEIYARRTLKQCDELFGKHVNARDLDRLVTLYEREQLSETKRGR